jgi:hypothetical protein
VLAPLFDLLCYPDPMPLSAHFAAVLPDSSAPDKGTRVKVAGVVVQDEGGHTDPTTVFGDFLTEAAPPSAARPQHQVVWADSSSSKQS